MDMTTKKLLTNSNIEFTTFLFGENYELSNQILNIIKIEDNIVICEHPKRGCIIEVDKRDIKQYL